MRERLQPSRRCRPRPVAASDQSLGTSVAMASLPRSMDTHSAEEGDKIVAAAAER